MNKVKNRFRELISVKYGVNDPARLPTLRKMADDIGVAPSTVMLWLDGEAQQINIDALTKICDFLGCSVGDILVYNGKQPVG